MLLISISSVVYLEIDNRQCYQQTSECFQSSNDVAAFLGALASSGNLNMPYVIEAVTSECLARALSCASRLPIMPLIKTRPPILLNIFSTPPSPPQPLTPPPPTADYRDHFEVCTFLPYNNEANALCALDRLNNQCGSLRADPLAPGTKNS